MHSVTYSRKVTEDSLLKVCVSCRMSTELKVKITECGLQADMFLLAYASVISTIIATAQRLLLKVSRSCAGKRNARVGQSDLSGLLPHDSGDKCHGGCRSKGALDTWLHY